MKSVLVIPFFITSLISAKLFSQNLEMEVFAGPAMTSLRGNRIIEDLYDAKVNLVTGVGFRYVLQDNWVLGAGIQYDRKGGRMEGSIVLRDPQNNPVTSTNAVAKLNFDYLTIPIECAKRFGHKNQFELGGGFYAAYLIQQKLKAEYSNGIPSEEISGTDGYKRLDLGLNVQFTSYIPLNETMSIKVRVVDHVGLTNVSDEPVADDGSIKHNSIALLVGVNVKM